MHFIREGLPGLRLFQVIDSPPHSIPVARADEWTYIHYGGRSARPAPSSRTHDRFDARPKSYLSGAPHGGNPHSTAVILNDEQLQATNVD